MTSPTVDSWQRRAGRLLHDVTSSTIASLLGAVILAALVTGGTIYWWRHDVESWFRSTTFVQNWMIAGAVIVAVGLMATAVVFAVKHRNLRRRDYLLTPPWEIRDTLMQLAWQLRRRPESWIHDDLDHGSSLGHIDSLIQGPFDGAALLTSSDPCLESLAVRSREDDEHYVYPRCPRCGRDVYDARMADELGPGPPLPGEWMRLDWLKRLSDAFEQTPHSVSSQ